MNTPKRNWKSCSNIQQNIPKPRSDQRYKNLFLLRNEFSSSLLQFDCLQFATAMLFNMGINFNIYQTLSQLPLKISPASSPKKLVKQHTELFYHEKPDKVNGIHHEEMYKVENKTSEEVSPELLDLKLLEIKYGVRKATTIERLFANIIDIALLLTLWWLFSNGQESAVLFALIIWLMCSGQVKSR